MALKSFILKKDNVLLAFYTGPQNDIYAIHPTIRPALAWATDVKFLLVYDTDDAPGIWFKIQTQAPPP